jgi:hypothetical protein
VTVTKGSPGVLEAGILPVEAAMLRAKTGRQRQAEGEYTDPHVLILEIPKANWNKA